MAISSTRMHRRCTIPCQCCREFIEDECRKDDLMMDAAMLEKLIAFSMRDEGGDKDVRIKDQFHDTLSNTS